MQPESAARFYAHDRGKPVQALRRRGQHVISPDYTIGWLTDLFVVVNSDAGFIAGCFNTITRMTCFTPRSNTAQCGSNAGGLMQSRLVYSLPYKSPFQKAAVLYKAAAIAVSPAPF